MLQNIGQYVILLIFIVAVVAIGFTACAAMGIAIPSWVIHVFWIVVIAFVCIGAIRLLTGGGIPPIT